MRELYPAVGEFQAEHIDVGGGHRVYVEQSGNPDGIPVVFLHGGPGSGCNPNHRRLFDPSYYRVILLDQRGSGRSQPLGETAANDIEALSADLEVIRAHLGIARWMVCGGSWGATLALHYARRYPDAVTAMVLRGVFLARREDIEWFFGDRGVARLFPDDYEDFVADIATPSVSDIFAIYHRQVHGDDTVVAEAWAARWVRWCDRIATSTLTQTGNGQSADLRPLVAKVRIETHYAIHAYFLADEPLIGSAGSLPNVPISIVHGRRDLVCVPEAAWSLHRALPGSRLTMVPDAGHLQVEPAIVDALVREIDRLRGTV